MSGNCEGDLSEKEFYASNSNSNSNSNSQSSSNSNVASHLNPHSTSKSQANPNALLSSNSQATSNPGLAPQALAENANRGEVRVWNEVARTAASYGWREKDLAVARELRVGQGPVCGPSPVKPEVLERIRRREEARAARRS
jgi:hypothetical protein